MIEIRLKNFPTHLPITKNKIKEDKYAKLNFQSVYNGSINRFARATLMENLHHYVAKRLPKTFGDLQFPIRPHYIIKTVINHGDIQRRNGNIIWKYPKEGYVPKWDIDNLAFIWIKGGNDAIASSGLIPDDCVFYLNGGSYEFIPVDDFEEREIIIQIQ